MSGQLNPERSLPVTGIEIQYLNGMRVTVERMNDGVHDVDSSVQDLKAGQAEVQDRLNAMYIMLCGGTSILFNIPLEDFD